LQKPSDKTARTSRSRPMSEHRGEAEYLLGSQLLQMIFAKLEQDAVERSIAAKPSDDETRRTCTQEVRAIRAVQRQLRVLAEDQTKAKPRPVV